MTSQARVRILHISDFHAREKRETESWRRRRVTGPAWNQILGELRQDGVDLVVFTGDAADWGLEAEYNEVDEFLENLLEQLHLPWSRCFVVPGNHDIARSVQKGIWRKVRDLAAQTDSLAFSRWAAGKENPPGFKKNWRAALLERGAAFRAWLHKKRPELDPSRHGHGTLGYRVTLDDWGFPLHLIGLDTAWLCGDDNDTGNIRLTENQLQALCHDSDGKPLTGVRLALMHHPLTELADGSHCRRRMAENLDLVLRGHLHEPELETVLDPDRGLRQLAAGCLYEGHRGDNYANACQLLTLNVDARGDLAQVDVRFLAFSPRAGHWHNDGSLYRNAPEGRFSWRLAPAPVADKGTNPYNPWQAEDVSRFAGREAELRRLELALEEGRSVSLVGDWRIGKSFLLRFWYARQQGTGRAVRLLSGEGPEAISIATFVAAITGYTQIPDEADPAADALAHWLERCSGGNPLILVDEFDAMASRFEPRFMERLRGMLTRLCLVLSTQRELDFIYQSVGRTSPFANKLELLQLGLLQDKAAEAVISWGGFDAADKALMKHWAGGHPYYLQLLGHCLFAEGCGERAVDRFWVDASARLRELWCVLAERDRRRLMGLLAGKPCMARRLRSRGLVLATGEAFAEVLLEFLREEA